MPKTRGRFSKSVRSDYRLLRQVNEVQPRLLRAISGDLQNEERRITRSQATTFLGSDDAASQVANDLGEGENNNTLLEIDDAVSLVVDELGEGDNDGAEQAQDQNNPDDTQDGVPSDSDTSSFSDGEFYGDSDSDWEEVDEPEEGINSEPLYPHSKINLLESCIMILSFVIRFKLPLASIKSLLQLIKCHMPEQSKLATSLYHIRKLLLFNNYKPLKNFYCGGCDKNLSEHENCFRRRCRGKKVHSFFTFDIEKQLKVLFARDTFRNAIMHRFNRTKVVDSNYEDIYDGDLYQRFANYFNDPYNFSMMFYSDGIKIFKASKSSIWPFFLIINELPFHLRFLPQNVLFGGLWFGPTKPNFNTFIRPLLPIFKKLQTGLSVVCEQAVIKVKGLLLNGIGDMPARSLMYNMINFNGAYGCMKCLTKGRSLQIPGKNNRSRVWIYPFRENLRMRDSQLCIKYGEEARNRPMYGVKGPTLFSQLVPDFITAMGIDSMHAVFAGVVKRIIELLTSIEFRNEKFSVYKQLAALEERLASLKPPHFVTRPPRSIQSCLSIFKTSEFKNFFFYYSIPLFLGILPELYLKHYIILVEAAYMLHSDSVSEEDIERAQIFLNLFVKDFEHLYGLRFMSANLHSLLHLPDAVRKAGPLWVNSCFPLEDLNGKVARLIHATKSPEHQICESFFVQQKLAFYKTKMEKDSIAKEFMRSLKRKACKTNEEIYQDIFSVGKYNDMNQLNSLLIEAYVNTDLTDKRFSVFFKLLSGKLLYVARGYGRAIRNVSYFAVINNQFIGLIECFVKVTNCKCGLGSYSCECLNFQYHAIVRKCVLIESDTLYDSSLVSEISVTDNIETVDVQSIKTMCYTSVIGERIFCAKLVNSLEAE